MWLISPELRVLFLDPFTVQCIPRRATSSILQDMIGTITFCVIQSPYRKRKSMWMPIGNGLLKMAFIPTEEPGEEYHDA